MIALASIERDMELEEQIEQNLSGSLVRYLFETLSGIEKIVPPLWPLKDYVAVNPFLGLSEQPFLLARQSLREIRDCELLPTMEDFRRKHELGGIDAASVRAALKQCAEEYPDLFEGWSVSEVFSLLEERVIRASRERFYFTLSEIIDRQANSQWTSHVINDITRHCAAHYDEGQALWGNPWKGVPMYQAWREAALLSWRMDSLGIKGFREVVRDLPDTPYEAIGWMLQKLQIPQGHWRGFLLSELFSIPGWASYIKYRVREAEGAGVRDADLVGLLAMRLAYDVALAISHEKHQQANLQALIAQAVPAQADPSDALAPSREVCCRYVLQHATEISFRQELLSQLKDRDVAEPAVDRKLAQLVFCIDVRSEVMRRHLESLTGSIETFGFAGFFGIPLEYVPLGETCGTPQCPVLIRPSLCVHETVSGAEETVVASAVRSRKETRTARKLWKSFQTSAASCFSFVESVGLTYFAKLLTDSLRWTRPIRPSHRDGLTIRGSAELGPDLSTATAHRWPLNKRMDVAESILRNLGLTSNFARIVILCGHGADVVNNPYKAGLDCGACGGHSGEPNARIAAGILNDPQVREALHARGIEIPDDTFFIAAVHNTTTDEVNLFDLEPLPESHFGELALLEHWLDEAGELCRHERSQRMRNSGSEDLFRRSRDWSETRPEWGLANNAAFIIAPRSRTLNIDLGGRAFMHSYDAKQDPDTKVLELIMTAPMIVTNWINMQYYASAVDNRSFGSGNKAIHNVVGQFGVLLGNGGDLMTGLPWQSVHDGKEFQHEPMRLLVVIEATREAVQTIIEKHAMVRELVSNGWMTLVVLEADQAYRWTSLGKFVCEPASLNGESMAFAANANTNQDYQLNGVES